jgi:nucleoside-diphosphate-sugar epimerase
MDSSSSPTEKYAGVTALVLGGSGFIGGWVIRLLSARGARVHGVIRDATKAASVRDIAAGDLTVADLARRGAITAIVRDVRPSVVFNLAGYGVDRTERDPETMALLNTHLVADLCEALATMPSDGWDGLRLVHAGSALEYGPVSGPLTADSEPGPTTDYGRTKLQGTDHVRRAGETHGLLCTVARLFTVYGPGEHSGRLLPSLMRAAETRSRVPLSTGEQRRDFTYVEDAAEGLLRMGVSHAKPGAVINLATGELTSVRTFAEIAAQVLGLDRDCLDFGAVPVRSDEMFHGVVDVSPVQELLSWRPQISIAEGVRRAWEHERAH